MSSRNPSNLPSVAVVGATGAVGREMLAVLEQRRFPHASIRAFASAKSAGERLPYRGGEIVVETLTQEALAGVDIALFSAGSGISKQFGPSAAAAGTIIIDNSSAFRMNEGVPLVIPEVNAPAMASLVGANRSAHERGGTRVGGIIANPNCSAIIMMVALDPVRRAFGIERIIVSTYQAASGAGAKGMAELESQTRAVLSGGEAVPEFFHEPYAFNLFSHNTAVDPERGLNVEEIKMIEESQKIWGDPGLRLSPTCIRVPVLRAHSESINVTLKRPASLKEFRAVFEKAPGVQLVDDRAANRFPTPLKASGGDDVLVGRIRPDFSAPDGEAAMGRSGERLLAFNLFVSGDQLRKGAALNAVQIAELLGRRHLKKAA
ncbi:MAG: aspartate-semialdehyde dehydrogenase [Pyrinomonadaceae bacterium]|nr:aspartate-semialdehyde dehydrogenase [Phycisphaerales bacterium]